jgi:hypothetical protein
VLASIPVPLRFVAATSLIAIMLSGPDAHTVRCAICVEVLADLVGGRDR